MFNIVSAWGAQTNPHYDPDTANNGGGYWQFSGGIVVDLNGQLISAALNAANICAWEVCYAD